MHGCVLNCGEPGACPANRCSPYQRRSDESVSAPVDTAPVAFTLTTSPFRRCAHQQMIFLGNWARLAAPLSAQTAARSARRGPRPRQRPHAALNSPRTLAPNARGGKVSRTAPLPTAGWCDGCCCASQRGVPSPVLACGRSPCTGHVHGRLPPVAGPRCSGAAELCALEPGRRLAGEGLDRQVRALGRAGASEAVPTRVRCGPGAPTRREAGPGLRG